MPRRSRPGSTGTRLCRSTQPPCTPRARWCCAVPSCLARGARWRERCGLGADELPVLTVGPAASRPGQETCRRRSLQAAFESVPLGRYRSSGLRCGRATDSAPAYRRLAALALAALRIAVGGRIERAGRRRASAVGFDLDSLVGQRIVLEVARLVPVGLALVVEELLALLSRWRRSGMRWGGHCRSPVVWCADQQSALPSPDALGPHFAPKSGSARANGAKGEATATPRGRARSLPSESPGRPHHCCAPVCFESSSSASRSA